MVVAFLRQISLDSSQVRIEAVFAIAKTSIDRKLAHFESLIEQELADVRRVVHLLLGAHRQIEHHENPHQPISAQISRLFHAGSSGSVICASADHSIGVGGSNKASEGRPVSNARASDWASRAAAIDAGEISPPIRRSKAINRAKRRLAGGSSAVIPPATIVVRSEEHTSELQSLMRISYAVFCLKKKTNIPR